MIKWLKFQIQKRLDFLIHVQIENAKKEMLINVEKKYYELKWKDFLADRTVEKIRHPLNESVKINLYKESYLSQLIFSNNFETETVKFINEYLPSDGCFVDVGANIGFFSLLAASLISEKGAVLSFEPTPDTFNKLTENIELNDIKNIFQYNVALSDHHGTAQFNISTDGHDAFNSFSLPQNGNSYDSQNINVQTLDDFYEILKEYANKIYIKIDVEGWEYSVLKGGINVLKDLNPVFIIEFNDENTKNLKYKCKDVYRLLASYGYQIYNMTGSQLTIKDNKDYFSYENLIAKK